MENSIQDVLELIVQQTKKLESSQFTKLIVEQGGIQQVKLEGQDWQLGVGETNMEAFILTFRQFISHKDILSFRKLRVRINDPELSQEWKIGFTEADKTVKQIFDGKPLSVNVVEVSRAAIIDIFFYGNLIHIDKLKRDVFEKWKSNKDIFAQLQFEFVTALVGILDQILKVGLLSQEELDKIKRVS